jgi:hypothetical protein
MQSTRCLASVVFSVGTRTAHLLAVTAAAAVLLAVLVAVVCPLALQEVQWLDHVRMQYVQRQAVAWR